MNQRRFITFVYPMLILVLIALIVPAAQMGAQGLQGNGQLKFKDKVTPADQQAREPGRNQCDAQLHPRS